MTGMNANWLTEDTGPSVTVEGMDDVTRFEVVDHHGRVMVKYGISVNAQLQDNGRTLKIFLTERPEEG
jgi:hypothetical protein